MWAELPRTINLEIDIKKRTEEHIAKQMRMVMKGKLQKEKTAADPNIKREYVDINRQEVDVKLKPKAVMKNGGLMLDKITNQNQKEWCQENVFDEIRVVIKLLISHIQQSGELDKYWERVNELNNEARKAARKVEKQRQKIERGSDYESSDDDKKNTSFSAIVEEDSWDATTS